MKESQRTKQSKGDFLKRDTILKFCNFYNNHCTFISPIYTFPWRENIIIYTPDQGTNRKKYFNHIIYQRKGCRLWREKTPFLPFLPSRTASFPSFDRKKYDPIHRKWTSKWLFPRRHNKYNINKRSRSFPYRE